MLVGIRFRPRTYNSRATDGRHTPGTWNPLSSLGDHVGSWSLSGSYTPGSVSIVRWNSSLSPRGPTRVLRKWLNARRCFTCLCVCERPHLSLYPCFDMQIPLLPSKIWKFVIHFRIHVYTVSNSCRNPNRIKDHGTGSVTIISITRYLRHLSPPISSFLPSLSPLPTNQPLNDRPHLKPHTPLHLLQKILCTL